MRPYIQIESLCKSFGQHGILLSLCLEIQKGDTVAITGPSGCGKTTLLNILGLLDTPDSGEIYLAGTRYPKINSTAAMLMRRNEINYLFQSFALIESRTVCDNLMLALHYTKLDTNEKLARIMAKGYDSWKDRPAVLGDDVMLVAACLCPHPDLPMDSSNSAEDTLAFAACGATLGKLPQKPAVAVSTLSPKLSRPKHHGLEVMALHMPTGIYLPTLLTA